MKRFVIAAALVAVGAASAFAGPIEDRQALMKTMAKNTKELAAVAKGETPFDAAKVKAQKAADTARKAGATFALIGALSLIIGAFIASAAAVLGGRQRDDDEVAYLTSR